MHTKIFWLKVRLGCVDEWLLGSPNNIAFYQEVTTSLPLSCMLAADNHIENAFSLQIISFCCIIAITRTRFFFSFFVSFSSSLFIITSMVIIEHFSYLDTLLDNGFFFNVFTFYPSFRASPITTVIEPFGEVTWYILSLIVWMNKIINNEFLHYK